MGRGIDTTEDCTPHIADIKRYGYTFVCRYYSHSAWKNLTIAEAKALSEACIYIVAVWETSGDHASFFTHAQGVADGEAAYQFGQRIGQPLGTPVYFAVDADLPCEPHSGVYSYFQGVNTAMGTHGQVGPYTGTEHHHAPVPSYDIGVYGSGHVCEALRDAKLVGYTWLAQSTAWMGSRSYQDWNIKQGPSVRIAGMSVDSDTSAKAGGGGFLVSV